MPLSVVENATTYFVCTSCSNVCVLNLEEKFQWILKYFFSTFVPNYRTIIKLKASVTLYNKSYSRNKWQKESYLSTI